MVGNPPAKQETSIRPLGREDPLKEGMASRSSILAGESHGQRSLAGYGPRGCKESNSTEPVTLPLLSTKAAGVVVTTASLQALLDASASCAECPGPSRRPPEAGAVLAPALWMWRVRHREVE